MKNNLGNKETMTKNIRRYLKKKGATMAALSDAIGVPYNTVNNWANAISYPRIDKIERMALFFGCSKADLVEEEETLRAEVLEKYAMERGGWSTPSVMRSVYQHTFSAKRRAVDDLIDEFFTNILCERKKMPFSVDFSAFRRGSIPLGSTIDDDL